MLRVPGQFGLIQRHRFVQVDLGADAGWPRHQDMSEWKRTIHLAPRAALDAAGRDQQASALRARTRELAALSADPVVAEIFADDIRTARHQLRRLAAQRLLCLSTDEAARAEAAGVPVFEVGYSRVSDTFTFRAPGQPRLTAHRYEEVRPSQPWPQVAAALWFDRMLRALSGGVVTEGAAQYARTTSHGGAHEDAVLEVPPLVRRLQPGATIPGLGAVTVAQLPASRQPLLGTTRAVRLAAVTVTIVPSLRRR